MFKLYAGYFPFALISPFDAFFRSVLCPWRCPSAQCISFPFGLLDLANGEALGEIWRRTQREIWGIYSLPSHSLQGCSLSGSCCGSVFQSSSSSSALGGALLLCSWVRPRVVVPTHISPQGCSLSAHAAVNSSFTELPSVKPFECAICFWSGLWFHLNLNRPLF